MEKNHEQNRSSRTQSMMDSFRKGRSLLHLGDSKKSILTLNIDNITIVNKQKFKGQKQCQVCFCFFTKTTRQHHCRICANAVCTQCSGSNINKQRACDVCAYHYNDRSRQFIKDQIIMKLKSTASMYIAGKMKIQEDINILNSEMPTEDEMKIDKESAECKIIELNKKLQNAKKQRQLLENQVKQIQFNHTSN